jgi:hypothetical protein
MGVGKRNGPYWDLYKTRYLTGLPVITPFIGLIQKEN